MIADDSGPVPKNEPSPRYRGHVLRSIQYIRTHSLKKTRSCSGNQCRARSEGKAESQVKFYKKRFRIEAGMHSFSNRVVNDWNSLPDEVVNAGSINLLKGK